jgi:predicted transcriptional regulator
MAKRPSPQDLIGWEEFTKGQGSYFKTEREILKPDEPTPDCGPRSKEYIIYDPNHIKVETMLEEESLFIDIVNKTEEELKARRRAIMSRITPYLNLIPQDESQMIELWYRGYTQGEIALMYEISQPTVWAKIDRGIQRLRYLTSLPITPKKMMQGLDSLLKDNLSEEEAELYKQIVLARVLTNGHTSIKTEIDISTQKIKRRWNHLKDLLAKEAKKSKTFSAILNTLVKAESTSVMRTSETVNVFFDERERIIRQVMPTAEVPDTYPAKAKRILNDNTVKWTPIHKKTPHKRPGKTREALQRKREELANTQKDLDNDKGEPNEQ